MEHLIPVVNKLQDVFGAIGSEGIDLPQIVVVGSQSSGKSSVLENIVGRDFLPRGSGIVTRRPLVLQLYSLTGGTAEPRTDKVSVNGKGDEWGEFLHLPGQKFYDFAEIRAEIARETERVTGRNKGISNKSINLKVYSPHVLNLTLVDLPGITRVPTGDQPEDVEDQLRNMCLEFITNPNAIILAVTAANQDLVNSDGLKMARAVDPDGDRTIGVLTKVDIMDAGTDCTDVLSNKVVPLKKGYIAVVNRSQKDIADGLPIRAGLSRENAFFQSHPHYRSCLSKCGTANLSRQLNQILMHHIRDCLPDIKSKITRMMVEVAGQLESLGPAGDTREQLGATMLRILSKFSGAVSSALDGRAGPDGGIEMHELYGGARIAFVFQEVFGRLLHAMDPFEGLSDEDIRTAIANANGTRPSLFVPEVSFDLLVRRQIARLEAPGLQCVEMVYDEMQRMVGQSESQAPELARFPLLRERALEVLNDMLRRCVKPAQRMISDLIKVELAYINTSHPDFIGGKQALALVTKRQLQREQINSGSAVESMGMSSGGSVTAEAITSSISGATSSSVADPSTPSARISVTHTGAGVNNTSDSSRGSVSHSGQQQQAGFFGLFRPPLSPAPANTNPVQPAPTTDDQNITRRPSRTNSAAPQPHLSHHSHMNGHNTNSSSSYASDRDSGGLLKLPQMPDRMRVTGGSNEWGHREVEVIKALLQSYFGLVRKSFADMVPKTVMHFLVCGFREGLQNELVAQLYKESLVAELMRETEDVEARRRSCVAMRDLLQRALEVVGEVRDFKPPAK